MAETKAKLMSVDPVWSRVCDEAVEMVQAEPLLGGLIHSSLLHHPTLERALSYRFSLKLASGEMSEQILREIADEAYAADPEIGQAARADIMAIFDRDPACHRYVQPILFFKGFQAVQAYRIGHWLWDQGRRDMAYFVQMRVSEVFGVDIHPAARIGRGLMIDHAHRRSSIRRPGPCGGKSSPDSACCALGRKSVWTRRWRARAARTARPHVPDPERQAQRHPARPDPARRVDGR